MTFDIETRDVQLLLNNVQQVVSRFVGLDDPDIDHLSALIIVECTCQYGNHKFLPFRSSRCARAIHRTMVSG